VERIAGYKAFCNKVWNAARFALLHLKEFRVEPGQFVGALPLSLADRWILSRLDRVIEGTRAALDAYQFSEAASLLYQFLWREFCDWYIELAKGTLTGDDAVARDTTRAVLVHCLDQVLRLLHPFMPFITEEIWQRLPFERPTESICLAPYPAPDPRLRAPAAEAEMQALVEAIDGLRTLRGESNLSPALRIAAHIHSDDAAVRATLERGRGYLMPLAGLGSLQVGPVGPPPQQAAAEVRAGMELYVPLAGLVDLAEERERLLKEVERAVKEIAQIDKKFENPNFAARAPAEVVEKDRARRTELEHRIAKLEDSLRRIAPVEPGPAAPAEEVVEVAEAPGVPSESKTMRQRPSKAMKPAPKVKKPAPKVKKPAARGRPLAKATTKAVRKPARQPAAAAKKPAPRSGKPTAARGPGSAKKGRPAARHGRGKGS
jgi:valyl-tRNA synthetase